MTDTLGFGKATEALVSPILQLETGIEHIVETGEKGIENIVTTGEKEVGTTLRFVIIGLVGAFIFSKYLGRARADSSFSSLPSKKKMMTDTPSDPELSLEDKVEGAVAINKVKQEMKNSIEENKEKSVPEKVSKIKEDVLDKPSETPVEEAVKDKIEDKIDKVADKIKDKPKEEQEKLADDAIQSVTSNPITTKTSTESALDTKEQREIRKEERQDVREEKIEKRLEMKRKKADDNKKKIAVINATKDSLKREGGLKQVIKDDIQIIKESASLLKELAKGKAFNKKERKKIILKAEELAGLYIDTKIRGTVEGLKIGLAVL